jgi:hypothetical protein
VTYLSVNYDVRVRLFLYSFTLHFAPSSSRSANPAK